MTAAASSDHIQEVQTFSVSAYQNRIECQSVSDYHTRTADYAGGVHKFQNAGRFQYIREADDCNV